MKRSTPHKTYRTVHKTYIIIFVLQNKVNERSPDTERNYRYVSPATLTQRRHAISCRKERRENLLILCSMVWKSAPQSHDSSCVDCESQISTYCQSTANLSTNFIFPLLPKSFRLESILKFCCIWKVFIWLTLFRDNAYISKKSY